MAADMPIDLRTPSPTTCSDGADDDADPVLENNSTSSLASSLKRPFSTPSSSSQDGTLDVHVSSKQKVVMPASAASALVISNIPHCRHKCPVHRFDTAASCIDTRGIFTQQTYVNKQTCDQCFCFICDINASSCPDWVTHCNASPTHAAWVNLRARHGVLLLSEMKGDPLTFISRKPDNFPPEYDTSGLGLEYDLKPWQKMMVSFMVNVEKNGVVLNNMFRPKVSTDILPARSHGGFLACEVGTGKTAAVVAAILAHWLDGVTLFVVPPLLVRQTVLEIKKFCKNINVDYIYGGQTAFETNQRRMVQQKVDVVVLSSGSKLADCLELRVRRVIFDEAHIIDSQIMPHTSRAFNMDFLSTIRHVWCISGTPLEFGFDDKAFLFQGRLISKVHVVFSKSSATIDNAQALILRLTKDAFPEHKWPTVNHTKLSVDLSAKHREMYDFLSCFDVSDLSTEEHAHPSALSLASFALRTHLRRLLLSENYDELRRQMNEIGSMKFKLNDTVDPSTLMAYRLKFDAVYDNFFNKGGLDENPKADAVMDEIKKQKALHSNYVAIIVTENTGIVSYFESSGLRIGVLQPPKAKAKYDENKTKQMFEDGAFDMLICSFIPMSLGLNLQLASQIFFIDLVTKEDVYKQALGRISRLSSLHDQVKITAVCVKNTIGELYCDYWADRRKGILPDEAVKKLWKGDRPHRMDYENSTIVYRPDIYPSLIKKDGRHFQTTHLNSIGRVDYAVKEEEKIQQFSVESRAARSINGTLGCVNTALSVIDKGSNAQIRLAISESQRFMLDSPHCKGFRVTLRMEKALSVINECTFNIDRSSEEGSEVLESMSSSLSSSPTRFHFFEATIPFDYAKFQPPIAGPDRFYECGHYVYPCYSRQFLDSGNNCLLAVEYIIVKDEQPAIFCPLMDRISIGKCSVTHCSICGFHREVKLLEVQHAGDRMITVDGDSIKSIADGYTILEERYRNLGTCYLSAKVGLNPGSTLPTDGFIDFLYEQHKETFIKSNSCIIAPNGDFDKDDAINKDFFENNNSFTSAVICLPEDVEVGDMVEYTFNDRQQMAYVDEILVIPFDDGDLKNCVKTWVKKPRTDSVVVRILASKKKV